VGDPIKVAIVDDDEGFRQAARGWLDGAGDILIVGEAQSGQGMTRWLRQVQPNVVLMDVTAASAVQMRQVTALAGVIVLHGAGQEPLVLEALRAGALGHLEKHNVRPPQALAAIRTVSRGQAVLSPGLAGRIVDEVAERYREGGADDQYPNTPIPNTQ